jgi:hypothetical protein
MMTRPGRQFDMRRFSEIAERANMTLDEFMAFLDSPTGRRMRYMVATGMIISVPFVMRIPGLRRSGIGRVIELVGGTALVVRLAEAVRDWERSGQPKAGPKTERGSVIDVPPAP